MLSLKCSFQRICYWNMQQSSLHWKLSQKELNAYRSIYTLWPDKKNLRVILHIWGEQPLMLNEDIFINTVNAPWFFLLETDPLS